MKMTESSSDLNSDLNSLVNQSSNFDIQITTRLPIAIMYLKEKSICNAENTKGWFGAVRVNHHKNMSIGNDEILKEIDFIRYKLTQISSQEVIVLDGVKDKDSGLLMAKTAGFFSDIYFVENEKEIALINGLYEFAEELTDLKSIARQLDEKIWQCFDALRPQLIERDWGVDRVKEIAKEVENLKYEDSDLIKQARNLFLTLSY